MSPKGESEQIQTKMMKDEEKCKNKALTKNRTEMENTKDLKMTLLIIIARKNIFKHAVLICCHQIRHLKIYICLYT